MDTLELSDAIQRALCLRCSTLEISSAFLDENEAVPATGRHIISLGKQSQTSTCDMCRFFLELSPTYKRNHKLHVRLFDHIKSAFEGQDFSRTRFLSVLRENSRLNYNFSIQDEIVQSGVVVHLPTNNSASPTSPVHLINTAAVDFGLVNSLLGHCQKSHGLCTQVKDRYSLPYIYLIDCIEGKVVRENPSQSYLALSYVWGQSSTQGGSHADFKDNSAWDSFSFNKTPLTVQDAIRVVRNLGKRYLWVDRYCIKQKDGPEKKTMIGNMDEIYENAEATIVAMYGENDSAGLPGVSSIPRTPQPRLQTAHGCLVSSCPPLATVIRTSKWATRGWTYQEARLSRRCLFFTTHQVYIVCREATVSEAVPSESQVSWISSLLNSSRLDARLFGPKTSIPTGFCEDRFVYSQRTLTHDSDILDAFRGILSHSSFITIWGVPITHLRAAMDPYTGFALGLLWTRIPWWDRPIHLASTKEPPRLRRVDFPTWSWTSVTGTIFNEQHGEKSLLARYLAADHSVSGQNDAHLRIWVHIGSKPVPLHDVMKQYPPILPEDSPRLLVQGDIIQVKPTPGKKSGRGQAYRVVGDEHSSLVFWANFDLDQDIAADATQDEEQENRVEDALLLLQWNDCFTKKPRSRFVMMLLRWVDGGTAERRGLLGEYRISYNAEKLK
ncbi:heterokaryon incompatibility protein-domain-containing protein [Bisporella sp. PMI_857]|nr:heterokaryon incompatibility protein-domain-containing protein [Bisporella sp. PMI_857]